MSGYQPAILVELVENEPTSEEIRGEAVVLISRNDHGSMEASGTFRSADVRLQDSERLPTMLFQYEGLAYEGNRRHEIRAVMVVKDGYGELYELEAYTVAIAMQELDTASNPVTFDDLLEFDPPNETN